VVAAKDTLYGLAKTYYGDASKWPRIVEANPGLVPERMPLGKTLIIP
jgi:nucleoid-associated protein YgaU